MIRTLAVLAMLSPLPANAAVACDIERAFTQEAEHAEATMRLSELVADATGIEIAWRTWEAAGSWASQLARAEAEWGQVCDAEQAQ